MTHLTAKTQTQQGATSFISIIVFFKQRAICINLYKNDLLLTWSKTKRQLINIVERENCFILQNKTIFKKEIKQNVWTYD